MKRVVLLLLVVIAVLTVAVSYLLLWKGPTRTLLSAPTTFHLNASRGVDSPKCGSEKSPCRTPQFMVNMLLADYDFAQRIVRVQFARGKYPKWSVNGPWVGLGSISFLPNVHFTGDINSPEDVTIDGEGGGYCIQANEQSAFVVKGMQIQNCALGLSAPVQHAQLYFDHVVWSSMPKGSIGIYASRGGYIEPIDDGNIINSVGSFFLQSTHDGIFRASALLAKKPFKLGADISCEGGAFAYASSNGDIAFSSYSDSAFDLADHKANCIQWSADSGGVFQAFNVTNGKSLTPIMFPGESPGYCLGECSIDQAAHARTTVSECGAGAVIRGNDYYGTITEGAGAMGCDIKFDSPFAGRPYCTVSWNSATPNGVSYAPAPDQIAVRHGNADGLAFTYQCKGF